MGGQDVPAYEAMFIFRPDLKEEGQKALITELENVLKQNQAKIENSKIFGRRYLTYELNKYKEGLYYLINFSASSDAVVPNLKRACNINENVLRILVLKRKHIEGEKNG